MNFKIILRYCNINIPLSVVAITQVCVDSLSYYSVNRDNKSGLKIAQNKVKLEMIWGIIDAKYKNWCVSNDIIHLNYLCLWGPTSEN